MSEEDLTVARWGLAAALTVSALLAAAFVCWLHEHGIYAPRQVFRFLRRPVGEVFVVLACIGGLVHHGATKGFLDGRGTAAPRSSMQSELASAPETHAVVAGMFPPYTNAVTNVCATGIRPAETSVFLRAHWPRNLSPIPTGVEVYAAPQLTASVWTGIGTATVSGDDGNAVVELPYSALPDGWTRSMFFLLGLNVDTDRDGLSDTFESIVSRTDPNLADTDGDGMPDGWEYGNGLDPRSEATDGEASADADGDGLSNLEEFAFGTNPHEPDTDGDGLTDAEEVGRVEELRGDGFLWFDTTGHANALGSESGIDSNRTKIPIPFGVEVNGVCYTNAQVDLDGLVTLIHPAHQTASIGSGYLKSGGVSNYLWSADHLTIAAYNADLYAKPRLEDWQSVLSYGTVTTNGTEYAVVEYRNVGHYNLRNESPAPMMAFQVILPKDETNTVYVSYRSVSASISERHEIQTFGVQLPTTNSLPERGTYANLPWSRHVGCFDEPLTLKYHLPTGTLPTEADQDGDGLSDADEVFVHRTDPFAADTDGDGLKDDEELACGTNPLLADTDGDGMTDGWEQQNGLNPLLADAESDPDGDGLPNKWEHCNGTNPQAADSDGDSLGDREESAWFDDNGASVPWFDIEPIQSFYPEQNVDSRLYFCELPFVCRLAGRQFTVAAADVNGVIHFAEPSTTNSISAANSGADLSQSRNRPYATVAAYWTDLCMRPSLNSSVTFGVGFAGTNRFFVIQYDRVGFWSGTANEASFQVSVCESEPGVVYVRYGTIRDARGGSPVVSMGCQGAKEPGFDVCPRLNYYHRNSPPAISEGTTIAYHFGSGGSPLLSDTDGDGLDDAAEDAVGNNPRRADTDGDGFSDREEIDYGMNPCSSVGADGADGDLDGDGLINRKERQAGTNPSLVDTDGDGLSDLEEVGRMSVESGREWIARDGADGIDLTGSFTDPDSSVVNYPLRNAMRVQGECVTNVIIDLNGVLYFPRCGRGADIRSSAGRNLDRPIYPDALIVAPYWRDLYITTNAPATRISVFETGTGTNGVFVLQYENACPYSNRSRTSATNALSFQVAVERGGAGAVHVVYKGLTGAGMDGQSANVGFQPLGGLWSHRFSYAQLLAASSGSDRPVVFNVYGQLSNGFGFSYFPGFGTDPLAADTDGDGIPDGQEAASGTGPMAPDSDGDGLLDGWEQTHGLDPADPNGDNGASGDPDNDGVPNLDEQERNTDPHNSDSDGDGISDGDEIAQGTDPNDRADTLPAQWVTVDGDLAKEVPKSTTATLSIPAGRTCLVCVFVASEEYPTYTGKASEFNDALYWNVSATGNTTLKETVRVNNEDGAWDAAEAASQGACGYFPVVLKDRALYTAGATDLPVSVTLRAMNVRDGALPSSVIVGLFPLNVVQANTPTATGVAGTTDAGTSYGRAIIPTNGVAYITGQPAAPQLTAQFKGLPGWIDVSWSGSLTTERTERGTRDDRTLRPKTQGGDEAYSISDALGGEIVGGSVSLRIAVPGRPTIDYPFRIRGKNPLDATARSYITANVDADFQSYAWMIAKHESRAAHTGQVYNQFNPSGDKKELPNWGTPDGWGMCQIDRSRNKSGILYTTTAEVYDWRESVAAMNETLASKSAAYSRFAGRYRSVYGNHPSWVEPEDFTKTIQGQVVSARVWAHLVLYNGVKGVPVQIVGGHEFQSPIEFVPGTVAGTGRWLFHDNVNNYGTTVITQRSLTSVE